MGHCRREFQAEGGSSNIPERNVPIGFQRNLEVRVFGHHQMSKTDRRPSFFPCPQFLASKESVHAHGAFKLQSKVLIPTLICNS